MTLTVVNYFHLTHHETHLATSSRWCTLKGSYTRAVAFKLHLRAVLPKKGILTNSRAKPTANGVRHREEAHAMTEEPKPKASRHDSYGVFTILAVLLPIIGIILGIVYLAKDSKLDKKLGEHLVALGILSIIIWSAVGWFALGATRVAPATIDTTTPISTAPAWDYQAAYDKVQDGMTQAQAEAVIGKSSSNCTETDSLGTKIESCTYGSYSDNGLVVVQYENGVVSSKSKSGM